MNQTTKQNYGSKKGHPQQKPNKESSTMENTESLSERSATGSSTGESVGAGAQNEKSFLSIISENLSGDSREIFDQAIDKVSEYVAAGKKYFEEKPAQAALIGVAVGFTVIAILTTTPGRRLVQRAAGRYVPSMNNWMSRVFKATTTH